MTQDILADQLGVSRQQISKWENDVTAPSDKQIEKICSIFQVTTDCLIVNQTVNVIEKENVAVEKPEKEFTEKEKIADIERREEKKIVSCVLRKERKTETIGFVEDPWYSVFGCRGCFLLFCRNFRFYSVFSVKRDRGYPYGVLCDKRTGYFSDGRNGCVRVCRRLFFQKI